jgi:hypothetical protein
MSDPSAETAIETDGAPTPDVNQAAPSTAEPEGVKSYRDTVLAVLDEPEKSPASDKPGEDASKQPPVDAEKPQGSTDPSDDELKQYSLNAQTRIRELVQRRKETEGELAAKTQEIEQFRPKAEQYDRITSFMQQNQIQPQELDNSMAITALVSSGRYADALKAIAPIYQELLVRTGNVLSDDLKQEVDAGYITANRAIELQRERMANKNAQDRERQQNERRDAEQHERFAKDRGQMYGQTATTWENAKKSSDPDWSTKQPLVADRMEAELHRLRMTDPTKLPSTPKAVHAFLDDVLKHVEDKIKVFRPKATSKDHETGRPASAGAKTKPASYMDAINQALGE